jgi:hypothetical protein
MKNRDGERIWKELRGPWAEARQTLHVEATAVRDLLARDSAGVQRSQRVIDARAVGLSHALEAVAYLTIGETSTAVGHLIAADAFRAVANLTDEQHEAACALAERGIAAGPLVTEMRKTADLVLGELCDARGCTEPGHHPDGPAPKIGERDVRRCRGPLNGMHPVLAVVPRPACARSRGPTPRGPAVVWRPT